MPKLSYRDELVEAFLFFTVLRDLFTPEDILSLEDYAAQAELDLDTLIAIMTTRYLKPRTPVPKAPNLQLAFEYAGSEEHQHRFVQMLRVVPDSFRHILSLIRDNRVIQNHSTTPQAPVEIQLAVTLYRLGRYGNGASVNDVARAAGVSEGSVLNFTNRCIEAILSLEDVIMRKITDEEKEVEKEWVTEQVGCPSFRNGWCTGDGTLVTLW